MGRCDSLITGEEALSSGDWGALNKDFVFFTS